MKTAIAAAISLLCAVMLFADDFGGEPSDKRIRFRATVQAVVPLSEFAGKITPASVDPRFALTLQIEKTVPEVPEWVAGKDVTFAIHSPSQLFEGAPKKSEVYDFIIYGKVQDGKLRYFGLGRGFPEMMDSSYAHYSKAQKYVAEGFHPIDCFAGIVTVKRKRIPLKSFSIYAANSDLKCCGALIKSTQTDKHGHILVEPMKAGEYFVEFDVSAVRYTASFAIVNDYKECIAEYVELDFSDVNLFKFQGFVMMDDGPGDCWRVQSDPGCFRK